MNSSIRPRHLIAGLVALLLVGLAAPAWALDAYRDFCDYRQREANRLDMDPATIGRADFLEGRREELIDRMRSRRGAEREMGVGYGRTSGWSSGKSYNSWRPGFRR